jgi:RNA polymerase sigma-70 factor (ECF subfamily)
MSWSYPLSPRGRPCLNPPDGSGRKDSLQDRNLSLKRETVSAKGEAGVARSQGLSIPADRTAALEWLMQEYGTKVMHLAYFYLKDRHLAEDVAQEVFIKAYRNWDSFRGESSPYTWLYKITVNLCRDKARGAWWRRLIPSDEPRATGRAADLTAPPEEGPEEAALRQGLHDEVMEQVLKLPEPYREAIVLYYFEDLSTVEIAEITGQNENTVKTRLFRARAMLKDLLSKGGVAR